MMLDRPVCLNGCVGTVGAGCVGTVGTGCTVGTVLLETEFLGKLNFRRWPAKIKLTGPKIKLTGQR